MGLQYLYENPEDFAKIDREYFDFTVLLPHGWLRTGDC